MRDRTSEARYQLGLISAKTGELWGDRFKGDTAFQEGYTEGLSQFMPEPPAEEEKDLEYELTAEDFEPPHSWMGYAGA